MAELVVILSSALVVETIALVATFLHLRRSKGIAMERRSVVGRLPFRGERDPESLARISKPKSDQNPGDGSTSRCGEANAPYMPSPSLDGRRRLPMPEQSTAGAVPRLSPKVLKTRTQRRSEETHRDRI
jgi:hypothetical protein